LNRFQSKKRKYTAIGWDDLSGTKVLVLPNGIAPCNKHVVELIEVVKPLIRQLVEDANLVSLYKLSSLFKLSLNI
jgi:proteasome activator subunit 3 (PA28 gamma)